LPEHCRYTASRIAYSNGGTALKCYSSGMLAPSLRIKTFKRASTDNVTVNKLGLDLHDESTEWFFIEDPFFGYHESLSDKNNPNSRSCHNVRLSLATATLEAQTQTIACILRSSKTIPENDCTHAINLDEPHAIASTPSIWPVARLWGFKQSLTTMPTVMAFSERGTRIAIAYWDKIYVWPLVPGALAGKWSTHRCYYYQKKYDSNLKRSLVELKPIVLDADAVVHKLAFTANENELVTITDRGVQIWNLGPSAIGRRTVRLLHENEDSEWEKEEEKNEENTVVQQPRAARNDLESARNENSGPNGPPATLLSTEHRKRILSATQQRETNNQTPNDAMMDVSPG
jgi:hypothetical protein